MADEGRTRGRSFPRPARMTRSPVGLNTRTARRCTAIKAHVACDEDTALIERAAVTPASVNDGKAGCEIIPEGHGLRSVPGWGCWKTRAWADFRCPLLV